MPECTCEICKMSYAVWFTDSDLWNNFSMGFNFLCPSCFTHFAEERGQCKTTAWYLTVEERASKIEVATPSASCNNARDVIPDCDVCENGTVRLPPFSPDLYRYCPWCSRELTPVA